MYLTKLCLFDIFELFDRMHGAHSCLVPINLYVANLFDHLQTNGKASASIQAADFRHLLLLLHLVLDNLFREEVDQYNRARAPGTAELLDPSEELVTVANTLVSWYKLFRRTNPPKHPQDVQTLTSQANRLLDMFSRVFPYKNKAGRLIMDTEKVHSIKHCGVEIANWVNPINTCCDGPEGGHKLWVKGQGGNTNQGPSASLSMMQQCVHKEASQLLCEAVQARVEDGDTDEEWQDKEGRPLHPKRWWTAGEIQDSSSHGPCMGIRVNIWERAKARRHLEHFLEGGGYDALRHESILHGDAGKLGRYDILSFLPDKVARFLYEYHDFRFQSLELPPIPQDRSEFDVHAALQPEQVLYSTLLELFVIFDLFDLFAAECTAPVARTTQL